jgi:hypothetical protein
MGIVWTEILNSVTMLSPFWALFRNIGRHNKCTLMHKLQIIHIPISVIFHAMCATSNKSPITNILRITDLTLIHVYGLVASRAISNAKKQKEKENKNRSHLLIKDHHHLNKPFYQMAILINTYCILSIVTNRQNDMVRIIGLALCGSDRLQDPSMKSIIPLGFASCLLYLIDEKLNGLGHPIFHILLGFLQNHLFMCLDN